MSTKFFVSITILHVVIGIVIPGIYLTVKGQIGFTKKNNFGLSWMLTSWGIFFVLSTLYVLTNYVFSNGLGGLVAFIIGVLPSISFALFSFWQAVVRFRKSRLN